MWRQLPTLLGILTLVAVLAPNSADATGGEGEAWPSFTESSSCGAQRIPTPHALETGSLPPSTLLRGEFAAMFGRRTDLVRRELVGWSVPGSSEVLSVHPRMIPALQAASADIERFLDEGDRYSIDRATTFSAGSRTIAGSLRISRHTFGTAFDVNTRRNPFRRDNTLVTDLPAWWVQSFLDAGFCWGGLWIGSKDAMHFAWMGPAFSNMKTLPAPYEPLTNQVPFAKPAVSVRVVPQPWPDTLATVLADADNNGAVDVIRVRERGADVLIEASLASRRHNACSSRVSIVAGGGNRARQAHTIGFGDLDGRGGQDLWMATDSDGSIRLTVRWAFGGYSAETSVVTGIPTPSPSAFISTADYDANGEIDVFVVDGASLDVWGIDPDTGQTDLLMSGTNPFPSADEYFLGDYDLDLRPDLWAIRSGDVAVSLAAKGYGGSTSPGHPLALPGDLRDVRAADYDGDGRLDLITFDGISKQVWLGNTRLSDGLALEVWFEFKEPDCRDDEPTWNRQELRFATSTWVAQGSYSWRTKAGLPTGCDPTEEDCQIDAVTARSFSEFLAWIDGLEAPEGNAIEPAGWALLGANYPVVCPITNAACWDTEMAPDETASAFGQFLAQRHGGVPPPHRWTSVALWSAYSGPAPR